MSDRIEQQLTDLFAADARRMPAVPALADTALRRVRRRRRRDVAVLALAGVLVLAGTTAAVAVVRPLAGGVPTAGRTGPVPVGGGMSCAVDYSPAAVAARAFALDATVTSIGRADGGYRAVRVSVHRWFAGGRTGSATIALPAGDGRVGDEAALSYRVGTRLLVSGETDIPGSPATMTAWGCGFTRYWDPATASAWAAATK
jgi:hypothetical protein